MKKDARAILLKAFQEQGALLFSSRLACLGLLKDYGGNDHPEINLLAGCVDLTIPQRLSLFTAADIDSEILSAMAIDFHTRRFFAVEICQWAVDSWAVAFELIPDEYADESTLKEPAQQPSSLPADSWYYYQDNTARGPIDRKALQALIQSGTVPAQTMIWTEGMADWRPSAEILTLIPADSQPLPPSQVIPSSDPPVSQVRPWIRYWARCIDSACGSFAAVIVLAMTFRSILNWSEPYITMALLFLCTFFEAAMLSTWGTTPGKALLCTSIRTVAGDKPDVSQAWRRSVSVYVKGLGFGFPLAAIFTQAIAYTKLTKEGAASWDRSENLTIIHRPISRGRIVLATIASIILFIVLCASVSDSTSTS